MQLKVKTPLLWFPTNHSLFSHETHQHHPKAVTSLNLSLCSIPRREWDIHFKCLARKCLSTNINKSHRLAVHGHPGNVILLFRTKTGPGVIRAEKINPCPRIANVWMWNIDLRDVSICRCKIGSLAHKSLPSTDHISAHESVSAGEEKCPTNVTF